MLRQEVQSSRVRIEPLTAAAEGTKCPWGWQELSQDCSPPGPQPGVTHVLGTGGGDPCVPSATPGGGSEGVPGVTRGSAGREAERGRRAPSRGPGQHCPARGTATPTRVRGQVPTGLPDLLAGGEAATSGVVARRTWGQRRSIIKMSEVSSRAGGDKSH